MKPKSYVLMVMILLVGISMVGGTLAVRAQSSADAPASASGNYLLPLVMGSSFDIPTPAPTPSPTPTSTAEGTIQIKSKSGIHMGNRSSDWNPAYFARIGYNSDGAWPAAVVVQSDQLFDYVRSTDAPCRISSASVKQVDGKEYELYRYLTQAVSEHGTMVVIRISPSPGNFRDEQGSGVITHTLLIDDTPAGGNYCPPPSDKPEEPTQADKVKSYRDILDVAKEMDAIYRLSVDTHKWPKENLFFESANEPNSEWYTEKTPKEGSLIPNVFDKEAWIAMDNYFAALYDRAKQPDLNPNLQILAPSMAQGSRGEHYYPGTCDNTDMTVTGGNGRTGLDFMKKVYGYDIWTDSYTTPKADGFAWHNYWQEGQEGWENVGIVPSLDVKCMGNESYEPRSDHIYQYFSGGMQASIGSHPTFITEADLQSPCQNALNPIGSKDQLPDGSNNAYRTRDSLLNFISQEFGASYVINWLLVNQFEAPVVSCADTEPNDEINWHEAYRESGEERLWFSLWWQDTQ